MPYVTEKIKHELRHRGPKNPGELNYMLTTVIREYLGYGYNYSKINDVIGALEACKLEFYRRRAVAYEDKKKEENGDAY